ncbi:MAG TPA: DnaB-like helicase C-terminal domain-containing protein [Candidatus Rifleibacterium sp.]|nr:DnaB-like helicase C-terminal domain-containing protein [Candidatus Rifleibacterium sp.]HPT48045.1 DnaB-like helicase C-terminal domain-containing protein [Candidatus Rifleibacterium sp.]
MANCNICNKEIQEGYICVECAKNQRPANTGPTAKPVASGFSLNNLLKTSGPANPTPAPAGMVPPRAPVMPASPAIPAARMPGAPVSPLSDSFRAKPPEIQHTSTADDNQVPDNFVTETESHEAPVEIPVARPAVATTQPARPFSTTLPTGATLTPPAPPMPTRPAAAPVARPVPAAAAPLNSQAINSQARDEQKHLQEEVFSSKETGYGDEELEISVLAGIMKDSFILESLKGKGLISGLFSTRYSRSIYQSILSLREENPEMSGLDKIVIKNKLRQLNLYDATVQTLIDRIMAETAPAMDQALHYLEMMKEQALKRKLKEVAQNIHGYIENPDQNETLNLETFTNKVIQDVRNIQKARTTKRINLVKDEMRDIMGDIDNREKTGEIEIIGYSCEPMHYLNTAISGFRKGFMYAIAGAPRRGKTTFTLELATRVATINKIPVMFFTYEQTKKNLTYRLLAKESRLNPDTLQRKKIRSDMIVDAKFAGGWKKMQEYMDNFYIIEATKEDTVDRIRSYAYNVMQDFNTDDIMIFIDYIQKMPLSRNYMDEKFKVEEISTELKGLSIELNNPIMTISSLSKEGCMVDATPDAERPTMYHCKGSGDLEYDLDCAMIQAKDWGDTRELYQQLQHKAEEMGKDTTRIPKVDVVNLYLDKNRDAPEGIFSTIQYLFFIEDNKFIELGPKFDDDRFRFSKIEELVDKLIEQNFIIFYDRPRDNSYNKGRVSIKLKNF